MRWPCRAGGGCGEQNENTDESGGAGRCDGAARTSGSSACGVAAGADGGMACGGSSSPLGTSQLNRLRRRQATTRPLRSAARRVQGIRALSASAIWRLTRRRWAAHDVHHPT